MYRPNNVLSHPKTLIKCLVWRIAKPFTLVMCLTIHAIPSTLNQQTSQCRTLLSPVWFSQFWSDSSPESLFPDCLISWPSTGTVEEHRQITFPLTWTPTQCAQSGSFQYQLLRQRSCPSAILAPRRLLLAFGWSVFRNVQQWWCAKKGAISGDMAYRRQRSIWGHSLPGRHRPWWTRHWLRVQTPAEDCHSPHVHFGTPSRFEKYGHQDTDATASFQSRAM